MRLWTVHPKYLDRLGLCAVWREALLAQAVLSGETTGYRSHPQLDRFRSHPESRSAISSYLLGIHAESLVRGYRFDSSKIREPGASVRLPETEGQLLWEWGHLREKLRARAPEVCSAFEELSVPEAHPMFRIVAGPVRDWERGA